MTASRPALVIFDMDDVLCHYHLGKRLRTLANYAGTTARDVRAALWDSGFEEASDAGAYPDPQKYLTEFAARLGYPISEQEWLDARRDAMTAIPAVIDCVRDISSQARVTVLTNNGPLVKTHFHYLLPEAAMLIPERFCSYEFGTKKPDPECYRRLLQKLDFAPSQCWFIDDKKSNVEGARIAGLKAHHFRQEDLFIDEARALGFKLQESDH